MKQENKFIDEKTKGEIKIKVFEYNTINEIRQEIYNKLKPYLLTLINKNIMKKDGTLLKKYETEINKLIKEYENEKILKPYKENYFIRFDYLYLKSDSYSLNINIKIGYKYGEKENPRFNEIQQQHARIEENLYLLDYEKKGLFVCNSQIKVLKMFDLEEFKPIDLNETLKKTEEVLKLRFEYEKGLNDLKTYTLKTIVKDYYLYNHLKE